IRVITSNPAKILKLKQKGHVEVERAADLILLEEDTLKVNTVFARGKMMVENGEALVKGTFEL
ncbi:amidohydrolase family protein, partial [Micrococcus sp. SIMBA_144]